MFEHMTFNNILSSTLSNIDDRYDKRQGSIIYDAIAPLCAQLAQFYIHLDKVIDEAFADTSSRQFLIKRAMERGIAPFPATHSIILASLNGDFSLSGGERFSLDSLNFYFTGEMEGQYFKLQCEQPGSIGNISYGELIPIDNIQGLSSAQVFKVFYFASDEEDTESFRQRYFNSFKYEAFGGNRSDYINKIKSLNSLQDITSNGGIGSCKVFRAPTGGGNVHIYILNSSFSSPSQTLIDLVQEKVDPISSRSSGSGIAPIGHFVTIISPQVTPIDFNFNIDLQEGVSLSDINSIISDSLNSYISSVCKSWENQSQLVLRISHIESLILDIDGVLDISNTTINGNPQNFILPSLNIPIIRNISFD